MGNSEPERLSDAELAAIERNHMVTKRAAARNKAAASRCHIERGKLLAEVRRLRQDLLDAEKNNARALATTQDVTRENNELTADVRRLRAENKELHKFKPTHGSCCACQRCGKDYDSCRCELDDVVEDNDKLRAENARLKQILAAAPVTQQEPAD